MKKPQDTPPVLLIDADVLVYQAAAGAEKIITWDDADSISPVCSLADAQAAFLDKLDRICTQLKSDEYVLAFSDSIERNFRRVLYPAYKMNRAGKARPVALKALREAVIADTPEERVYIRPSLEADDCLGILATHRRFRPEQAKIIVSIDKDLKGIPGQFFNIGHPEEGVQKISPEQASRWHMLQTLMGDTSDGYPGCPGIGVKKAEKLLDGLHTVAEMWPVIVSAYTKAGLTEADALMQAQIARILHACDYNFNTKEVKLWKAPR